jgi:hypothetical protein
LDCQGEGSIAVFSLFVGVFGLAFEDVFDPVGRLIVLEVEDQTDEFIEFGFFHCQTSC